MCHELNSWASGWDRRYDGGIWGFWRCHCMATVAAFVVRAAAAAVCLFFLGICVLRLIYVPDVRLRERLAITCMACQLHVLNSLCTGA
jgi:hypothetical protein